MLNRWNFLKTGFYEGININDYYARLISELTSSIEADPDDGRGHVLRGNAHLDARDF